MKDEKYKSPELAKLNEIELRLPTPTRKPKACMIRLEEDKDTIAEFIQQNPQGFNIELFHQLLSKLCGYPFFISSVLFQRLSNERDIISESDFLTFWTSELEPFDQATRFFNALKGNDNIIRPGNLLPFFEELLYVHPGLQFLKDSPQVQQRYVETIITRIFYSMRKFTSKRISLREFEKYKLMESILQAEQEADINNCKEFSYEHFYVIYSKFWELDQDHDLLLHREDLAQYSSEALSRRIINRVFDVLELQGRTINGLMTFEDFICFMLSEEDKATESSVEYWFNCLDLDGDGFISLYEIEFFYEEQYQRVLELGGEAMSFSDFSCQILDMIKPKEGTKITCRDLKSSRSACIFLDSLLNVKKFMEDQVKSKSTFFREVGLSNWELFAAEEYEKAASCETDHDASSCCSGRRPDCEYDTDTRHL